MTETTPIQEAQSASPSSYIELFELDASALTSATGTVGGKTYFTNSEEVTVGDQVYLSIPVELTGLEFEGGAAPARPSLTLGAITGGIRTLILQYGNLLGARITISRIFKAHLADPSQIFGRATFVLDRLTELSKTQATWELLSTLDFEGYKLPRRFISRDYCPFSVRRWTGSEWDSEGAQCPYNGSTIYDENGEQTDDPTREHFAKTLTGCCKLRARKYSFIAFGQPHGLVNADSGWTTSDMPFGGFPGAER